MSNFFIEKNNCSSPSLWHTDASYSALSMIHFPNTASILAMIRSAHWMLAAINLSVRGLPCGPPNRSSAVCMWRLARIAIRLCKLIDRNDGKHAQKILSIAR
jgi:hypothetical protein